jgi:glycerophosphoryl diester phosphodiesterase
MKKTLFFVAAGAAAVTRPGAFTASAAPRARFISHRGESMNAPENTVAAFRAAVEKGADGFECDIYLTKDNEIVCLHDKTAKRTAGMDVKPCDATLAELRALDAGAWKGPQFKGERIPTLAETLALARDNFEIYVEVKCGTEIMPRLAEVMAAEPKATPERVVFICFNTNVVSAVRERFPAYRAYWLTGTGPKKDGKPGITAGEAVAAAKACNASGVSAQNSADITPEFVNTVKAAGFSFHIWTVNNAPRAAELAAMGVETVTSDCGAAIKAVLHGKPDTRPAIHWTFDGTAKNSGAGGARCDATLPDKPIYTEGVNGQGLRLDGAKDAVSVPYQLTEQGTVALWYKPEAFYNFNTVVDNDLNPDMWEMWIDGEGRLRFRIVGESGDLTCDLNGLGGPGRWYHFAVAWDYLSANEAKLYVDGVERAAAPVKRWVAPGGTFFIGGGNPGNKKGKGAVDDVRVYAVPLSAERVRALAGK